jgi:5-methylcytosine-specific restriction endonuclease McrA
MKMKWPENYQERIETIIGAKYDETRYVYFLGFDFKTVREAKDCITKIQLMQKQLRQLKTEINNKIKVVKAQRMPRARKKDGALLVFASLLTDLTSGHKITDYQYVILNLEKLLDACERRKNEIEVWIEQQRPSLNDGSFSRERIPDDVQVFVWNRDGGKCVKCGSQENLEFDHIIPLSKGGSNTARNIQLLCETHNREKSNSIGG